MKKIVLPLVLFTVLASILGILVVRNKSSENASNAVLLDKQDRIDLAMKYEYEITKDPATGDVPRERLIEAREAQLQRLANPLSRAAVPGIGWEERGPSNVGGRTRVVAFDLGDAANGYKKVWAAGVAGGLWRCNDITASTPAWTKINDLWDNIAITAWAQDPANPQIMYVGTGEGWFNADAVRGFGIYKSTDGGATWTRLTSTNNFRWVQDLQIDKEGNLFAAVRRYFTTDASGIQRSADGGATWTQALSSLNSGGGSAEEGADLELAANGDLYASLGVSGRNGGIYRSAYVANATGTAGSWQMITPSATGTVLTAIPNPVIWHRIELATAPNNANIVYALFQGAGSNDCTSIQQYNARTNTWSVKTVPTILDQGNNSNFTRGQAWYDLIAAVDPNDSLSLYIGGVDALRSDNGGTTWTQMTTWSLFAAPGFGAAQNVHADQHMITYAPGSSSRALWGTDGGVDYTENANVMAASKPTYVDKNNGYNITQYYAVAMHPTNANFFLGGTQDNGSHRFTNAGINAVTEVTGGDGAFCHIDQLNPQVQITSYVYNNYYVSTNGGASFAARNFGNTGSFINPTDYDDVAKKLYGGNNAGTFFRWENPATAGSTGTNVSCPQFGTASVRHVRVSPNVPHRVYFGLSNGSVVRVENAHTGTSVVGTVIRAAAGTLSVSSLDIQGSTDDHMIMTYSNYGTVSVFETLNGEAAAPAWTAVEGNLPDMPIRWAQFDPRNPDWALVATELGVWSTDNLNGATTDWQPTNTGLANTRIDMLQYRHGDRTLAAATHGRGLFTAVVPILNPEISFANRFASVGEASTIATCRRYTDYAVSVNINKAPTGDATVTFAVNGGATARRGVDFDFTTNGNFGTPSAIHTFAAGATAAKTVTIRVYDDAEVEPSETFTLSYTIGSTTDAVAGANNQVYTVTITDNDRAPIAGGTATTTIGTFTTTLTQPFRSEHSDARTQTLYLATELQAAGFSAGLISAISLDIATKVTTKPFKGFTVKMKNTTTSALTGGVAFESGTTPVFGPVDYSTVAGVNAFTLASPFVWDGTSNLLVEYCYNNEDADKTTAGTNDLVKGTGGIALSQFERVSTAGNPGGCALPSATFTFTGGARPTLGITLTSTGTNIATAANTARNEYAANATDQYYWSGNLILARLKNTGTHKFGCTVVRIDRAGTGAEPFWNDNPSNYLMSKAYFVAPTTNSATGQAEVTFYFTDAEKTGWEAATGQSWSSIMVVKTPNPITLYNPAVFTGTFGDVEFLMPVRGTLGTGHTLTVTTNTGFSGFGFGVAGFPLPVTITQFTGSIVGQVAHLNWTTSYEREVAYFELQKSTDGLVFTSIGRIPARGNSTSPQFYTGKDLHLTEKNYYRLRTVDIDGSFALSNIVLLRHTVTAQNIWVVNNPFGSFIDLRFARPIADRMQVILTDAKGSRLFSKEYQGVNNVLRVDLSALVLVQGVYHLQVQTGQQRYHFKVVLQ